MALKAILDSLDGLSEDVAKEYVENEKRFFLDVTAVDDYELVDTAGLKSSLGKERKRADKAEKTLKTFDGIDDPEAARDALTKVEEMDDWDPEKKLEEHKTRFETQLTDKYEKDRVKLQAEFDKELSEKGTVNETLTTQLRKVLVKSEAAKAIAEAGGSIELLSPIVSGKAKMVIDDDTGEFIVRILDAAGDERISPKPGSSSAMTIAELVEELKSDEKYGRAFDGDGTSGSGAGGTGPQRKGSTLVLSAVDAKDTAKYRAAKAEAEKTGVELQIAGV